MPSMTPFARMLDAFLCQDYSRINNNTGLDLYRNPYYELMTEIKKPANISDSLVEYVLIKRLMLINTTIDNGIKYNELIRKSFDSGYIIDDFAIMIVLDYDTSNFIMINDDILKLLHYLANNYKFDIGDNGTRLVNFDYLDNFYCYEGYLVDTDFYNIIEKFRTSYSRCSKECINEI